MSLINQMLQDLDARRAAHGAGTRLPDAVRPLPPRKTSRLPLFLGIGIVLVLIAGAVLYYGHGITSGFLPSASAPAPVQAPASVPAPTPDPTPAPVTVEAAAPVPLPETATAAESRDSLLLDKTLPATLPALPQSDAAAPAAAPNEPPPVMAKPRKVVPETAEKAASATPAAHETQEKPITPTKEKQALANPPAPKPVIERSHVSGGVLSTAEGEYQQAVSRLNQGRTREALDGLHLALRHDTGHIAARQLLIGLLLEAKALDEAMQALREGIQRRPEQVSWALALARMQVERGALEEARQTLVHSLPAAADRADYQGFIAHVLLRLKHGKEAEQHYQQATRLAPGDGRWWLGLGLAQEAEGQVNEARESFLRARQTGRLSPELMELVEQKLK